MTKRYRTFSLRLSGRMASHVLPLGKCSVVMFGCMVYYIYPTEVAEHYAVN
jgi:hypothetical protein